MPYAMPLSAIFILCCRFRYIVTHATRYCFRDMLERLFCFDLLLLRRYAPRGALLLRDAYGYAAESYGGLLMLTLMRHYAAA